MSPSRMKVPRQSVSTHRNHIGRNSARTAKPLFYQDPEALAKNVTHQVLWTETTAGPANVPSRSSSASVINATNVDFRTFCGTERFGANYLIQHQSAEDDAVRKQGKQTLVNTAQQIRALALKPGAIEAGAKVAGAVWFRARQESPAIDSAYSIENQLLEFPLFFHQQR